jgi:2-polyprenyl-3-methyl-5-hydroxy-6-metoxy-1,4-benzoquinol methylase
MKTHLDYLLETFPGILTTPIIDIGSGRGAFLIQTALRGARAVGIEYKRENITTAIERARQNGVEINLREGRGEELPFENNQFGFANVCEVIEHVQDPEAVLSELYRVLQPYGQAYLSAPNRLGLKDQHFHLYGINWLPRRSANWIIGLLGKHKIYDGESGLQRLDQMHYFTYRRIKSLASSEGFNVTDIRKEKIWNKLGLAAYVIIPVYFIARTFLLDSFHLKLVKIA